MQDDSNAGSNAELPKSTSKVAVKSMQWRTKLQETKRNFMVAKRANRKTYADCELVVIQWQSDRQQLVCIPDQGPNPYRRHSGSCTLQ